MADDRGRIHLMLPALRSYVFPAGDISERQFEKALGELIAVKFCWRYRVEPWDYLWLPTFWRHQRINRPSESSLPPHPDDPHGGLSVADAMDAFKAADSASTHDAFSADSVINHGTLIASRARARSDPNPVVVHLTEHLAGRVRANDPKFDLAKARSTRWLEDMRLLLADRGGDADEIERVIDWCAMDRFESANVQSPGKLRTRFSQLLVKSRAVPGAEVSHLDAAKRARVERQQRGLAAIRRETERNSA